MIRPVLVYLSLIGTDLQKKEKLGISFFGIRGMGSLFYLAFAFGETEFESEESLWSVVAFTIALSITVHGLAATPVIRRNCQSQKHKIGLKSSLHSPDCGQNSPFFSK